MVPSAAPSHESGHSTLSKALIVEVDEDTRFLYRTALSPYAATIDEAIDGAEALGKAICDPPTVIVTEVLLPRMDGFKLCTALRTNPRTAGVYIVVVTTVASSPVRDLALAAGADAVLVKPCPIDHLVATVRHVSQTAGHHRAGPSSDGATTANGCC